MAVCGICNLNFSCKNYFKCSGPCNLFFHSKCANIPSDLCALLNNPNSGLRWFCASCREPNPSDVFAKFIESYEKSSLEILTSHFFKLKEEFLNSTRSQLNDFFSTTKQHAQCVNNDDPSNRKTYSQMLLSEPKSKIVIKPKTDQHISLTEKDILESIDFQNDDVKIKNIKHTSNGGLVLSCASSHPPTIIKESTVNKLADKYNIHEIKSVSPSLKIVGMPKCVKEQDFTAYLKKQNNDFFSDSSYCKLIKYFPTKKNTDIYQAIIEVDCATYNNLINAGQVIIGLRACAVHDAISVLRCFNCNGFNHGKKYCKRVVNCPRCAGAHEMSNCTLGDGKLQCNNCLLLKARQPDTSVDVNHAAWETHKCSAYGLALKKLKSDVFEIESSK